MLRYAWGDVTRNDHNVMMAPIVTQLDDDSCDGVVNERDLPDIAFLTFAGSNYQTEGVLRIVSVVEGALLEKWSFGPTEHTLNPGGHLAGGDFHASAGGEIAACSSDGRVYAIDKAGQVLWLSEYVGSCYSPNLADLDQDGEVEVIVESAILDGQTGAIEVALPQPWHSRIIVDVDGDDALEIATGMLALRRDASLLANSMLPGAMSPAAGDLNHDGHPEIISIDYANHTLHIWSYDPTSQLPIIMRSGIDINGPLDPMRCPEGSAGRLHGGGPATVADFNGDGTPDVALAGGVGYAVFDGKKLADLSVANADTLLWAKETIDCSSAATGSSVFDFEGDGSAEVLYADEVALHVYRGSDGADLITLCNTSGTLDEYPLVADVDNDNQADIIVASNNYSSTCGDGSRTTGVRVFGAANRNWVNTRRIWNQFAYHVTNVTDDGQIPAVEAPNITSPRLNNYRQNIQPAGEFSAPDLIVEFACETLVDTARVTVRNIGSAATQGEIPVRFFVGDPASGGLELSGSPLFVSRTMFPLDAEVVSLPLAQSLAPGAVLYATVDDAPMHAWRECRLDNNGSNSADVCIFE